MSKPYSIKKPTVQRLPLIFDSPHSGTEYPQDFDFVCDFHALRQAEDQFVDDLFSSAPEYGGTLLSAHFPRTYIDPNRAEDDIDLSICEGAFDGPAAPTHRSEAGIGLIRRLLKPGTPIYDRKLSVQEIQNRIDHYYRPYWNALEELYENARYNFGQVYHINCHSMPHESSYPHRPIGLSGYGGREADFCIGTRDGNTTNHAFVDIVRTSLRAKGYVVTIDDPFKGVELIGRFSDASRGAHAIQLEINKSLYMNEDTMEPNARYNRLKDTISHLIKDVSAYVEDQLRPMAAD